MSLQSRKSIKHEKFLQTILEQSNQFIYIYLVIQFFSLSSLYNSNSIQIKQPPLQLIIPQINQHRFKNLLILLQYFVLLGKFNELQFLILLKLSLLFLNILIIEGEVLSGQIYLYCVLGQTRRNKNCFFQNYMPYASYLINALFQKSTFFFFLIFFTLSTFEERVALEYFKSHLREYFCIILKSNISTKKLNQLNQLVWMAQKLIQQVSLLYTDNDK
ncbi:unnamed protein product [Paramecium pentaurelia]|uniref:Transmembrane protein n=1 Tax=Paramecium pentaurelia TaxID=43138 RepID=A0A8S1VJS0_9CILI|nr:unnamed protein product [Paramecium pentaurelia]